MNLLYTPICINLNLQFPTCDGINQISTLPICYLKIKPPRNLKNLSIGINKHQRIYLKNNQATILLPPTQGATIDNFYEVKYYAKPCEACKGKLVKTEYWAIPLYNKCFQGYQGSNPCCTKNSGKGKCSCAACNLHGCKPRNLADCYSSNCVSKYEMEFTIDTNQYGLSQLPEILLITRVKINDQILKNWNYAGQVLDLTLVPDLPVVVDRNTPTVYPMIIEYVTPLGLCDIFIQTEPCFNDPCFVPGCC